VASAVMRSSLVLLGYGRGRKYPDRANLDSLVPGLLRFKVSPGQSQTRGCRLRSDGQPP